MKSELLKVVPQLPCHSVEETIEFYENKLGFEVTQYDNFLIVSRENIEIHLWLTNDRNLSANSSCYIRVKGIDTIYEVLEKQGVIHTNGKLETKPWGTKEFVVRDNNGNGLIFGELI